MLASDGNEASSSIEYPKAAATDFTAVSLLDSPLSATAAYLSRTVSVIDDIPISRPTDLYCRKSSNDDIVG
jgi:hypothetical protein